MDKAIHRINHYPADSVVCFVSTLIHWIAIYPVDSVIQPLNNWDLFVSYHLFVRTQRFQQYTVEIKSS